MKKNFINILILELICMYMCLSCEMNKGNDSIVYVVINMYIIKLLIVLNVWYLFIINLYKSFLKIFFSIYLIELINSEGDNLLNG